MQSGDVGMYHLGILVIFFDDISCGERITQAALSWSNVWVQFYFGNLFLSRSPHLLWEARKISHDENHEVPRDTLHLDFGP